MTRKDFAMPHFRLARMQERARNTRERATNAHPSLRAMFADSAEDFEWACEEIVRLTSENVRLRALLGDKEK